MRIRNPRRNKDRLCCPAESSYSLYARIILMADVLTVLRCIWLLAVAAALLPLYLGSPLVTQENRPVMWIRIHRIHMFLGLLDPDPDPLVRGMDPDPDPSITRQK